MNDDKNYKIMFVCHGNICRSPMAEFVFKDIVKNSGKENCFTVRSCATSDEETGNPFIRPQKRSLKSTEYRATANSPSDFYRPITKNTICSFVWTKTIYAIRLIFSAATRKGKLKNCSVLQAPIATLPTRGITADLTKLTTIFLPGAKRCLLI